MKLNKGSDNQQVAETGIMPGVSRRHFLQLAGGIAGAGLIMSSCAKTPADTVYLGSGDTALLNYLYIMEQVMAAFYKQANITQYYGLTAQELTLQADLRDHQYAHKGLLKAILGGSAVPDVVTDLSAVTFADRTNTINHAIMFEDLAVGAYNGVAQYFSDTSYVLLTAKMGTVQARHAAYMRDILSANTFADSTVVTSDGLGQAFSPLTVFPILKQYIQTKFDSTKLPG